MVCISDKNEVVMVVWPAFSIINNVENIPESSSQKEEDSDDETVYDW